MRAAAAALSLKPRQPCAFQAAESHHEGLHQGGHRNPAKTRSESRNMNRETTDVVTTFNDEVHAHETYALKLRQAELKMPIYADNED